jgi:hypothetical protein
MSEHILLCGATAAAYDTPMTRPQACTMASSRERTKCLGSCPARKGHR